MRRESYRVPQRLGYQKNMNWFYIGLAFNLITIVFILLLLVLV